MMIRFAGAAALAALSLASAAQASDGPMPTREEEFRADMTQGMTAGAAGDFDTAFARFDAAVTLQPASAAALSNRGMAYMMKRNFVAARSDADAALRADPNLPMALHVRASLAERDGDLAMAEALYTRMLQHAPNFYPALVERSQIYSAQGHYDAARTDIAAAKAAAPDNPAVRDAELEIFRASGDFPGYLKTAEALAQRSPTDPEALNRRAAGLALTGRRADAVAQYTRSLAVKPTAMAYAGRAELRPDNEQAEAFADIEGALKLEPRYSEALVVRGKWLEKAGRMDEALAGYERQLVDEPNNAQLLNTTCWLKATHNIGLEGALAQCDAALRISPGASAILDSRGFVKLRLGRFDEAISDYDSALKDRKIAASFYGRGVARLRRGDRAGGKADLAQARTIDPKIDEAFKGYGVRPPN